MTDEQYPQGMMPYYCDYVCGALLAFRKKTWLDVGGFEQNGKWGPDDSYFCLKAWEKGWKVLYDPEVKAVHVSGGVRGKKAYFKNTLEKEKLSIENYEGLEFFQRNYWKWDLNPIFRKVHAANVELYPETSDIIKICRWDARGDVLAMTGAVHQLKVENPGSKIHVRTKNTDIFKGNPDVVAVGPDINFPLGLKIELNCATERKPQANLYETYERAILESPRNIGLSPQLTSEKTDRFAMMEKVKLSFGGGIPKKLCALHTPITHWKSRFIPPILGRKICQELAANGYGILSIGGERDILPGHSSVADFRGSTVAELKEIIELCDVFIGPDSFPMHLCLATNTPGVALFTSTAPEGFLPIGQTQIKPIIADIKCAGCRLRQRPPVYHLECPGNNEYECVYAFDAVEVARAAMNASK
jgi:ADP-heptose:LPS heptosyltransferase